MVNISEILELESLLTSLTQKSRLYSCCYSHTRDPWQFLKTQFLSDLESGLSFSSDSMKWPYPGNSSNLGGGGNVRSKEALLHFSSRVELKCSYVDHSAFSKL